MKYRINTTQKKVANFPNSKFKIPNSAHRGAALLMAVLMTSVMLSVGLGVYQRTYKELYFSSFWKQAQVAFAAADAGLECALYWELHSGGGVASCFGSSISGWDPRTTGSFSVNTSNGGCVEVSISWDGTATTTEARGHNDGCTSTSPRRVERGLKITY